MKKTISIIGLIGIIATSAYFYAIQPRDADGNSLANLPKPKSDVPIEYKIGWWAYQGGLSVETIETNTIYDQLNLFNNTAIVEYKLTGTISYKPRWKPYIKKVHISEYRESPQSNPQPPTATIIITPIVGTQSDDSYNGETITFNVKIQDYLQSGNWGINQYLIRSQNQTSELELKQRK